MKIKNMIYAAMFAAIVAVLGLMPPIPLPFIKQCKNTRDSSTRRVLVMRLRTRRV